MQFTLSLDQYLGLCFYSKLICYWGIYKCITLIILSWSFAGWGWKREEGEVPNLPANCSDSRSGLPGFGSLCFQPEISVGPQPGEGKTKYHLRDICQSLALLPPSVVSGFFMRDRWKPPWVSTSGYIKEKKKLCEKGKWMATQKSSRQSLQSVLYSCRLKDVWAMEKTAVFRSARVLAVRSVILWILGPNHKPLFTIVNVALLHLSAFCSHCKYGLTITNRDNSKLTLIAVDQSGCSRTEASWQCNWDKLLSWQFIL